MEGVAGAGRGLNRRGAENKGAEAKKCDEETRAPGGRREERATIHLSMNSSIFYIIGVVVVVVIILKFAGLW